METTAKFKSPMLGRIQALTEALSNEGTQRLTPKNAMNVLNEAQALIPHLPENEQAQKSSSLIHTFGTYVLTELEKLISIDGEGTFPSRIDTLIGLLQTLNKLLDDDNRKRYHDAIKKELDSKTICLPETFKKTHFRGIVHLHDSLTGALKLLHLNPDGTPAEAEEENQRLVAKASAFREAINCALNDKAVREELAAIAPEKTIGVAEFSNADNIQAFINQLGELIRSADPVTIIRKVLYWLEHDHDFAITTAITQLHFALEKLGHDNLPPFERNLNPTSAIEMLQTLLPFAAPHLAPKAKVEPTAAAKTAPVQIA